MSTKTKNGWSAKIEDRNDLNIEANTFASQKSAESLRNGHGGSELRLAEWAMSDFGLFGQTTDVPLGYIYDQLLDNVGSGSDFVIGPFRFAHSVQNIQISEEKSVIAPKAVRSDKPLVIDGGISRHVATISFLFSGIDEINTFARGLVAMFRVCPITSVRNEMISMEWGPHQADFLEKAADRVMESAEKLDNVEQRNKLYVDLASAIRKGEFVDNYLAIVTKLQKDFVDSGTKSGAVLSEVEAISQSLLAYKSNSKFIPVAMESLSVQTVPDLPNTLSVSLILNKIDVSSVTEAGVLEYQGQDPAERSPDPKKAYWLKKYLYRDLLLKDTPFLPMLFESDFNEVKFDFFNKPLVGTALEMQVGPEPVIFDIKSDAVSKIGGQSATITNHFGYQRFIGKSTTCTHHMGTSARQLTLDLQFVTGPEGDNVYQKFNEFKELSDELVRSQIVYERVLGWNLRCVTGLLLGGSTSGVQASRSGVYVPLASTTDTGEVPHLKDTRITLAETNTSFADSYQIILDSGGIGVEDLKEFFFGRAHTPKGSELTKQVGICPGEENYRANIGPKPIDIIAAAGHTFSYQGRQPQGQPGSPAKGYTFGTANKVPRFIKNPKRQTEEWEDAAWRIFWPLSSDHTFTAHGNAILNRDVFRAALLSKQFDKEGVLKRALIQDPIFSGKLRSTQSVSGYTGFKLGLRHIIAPVAAYEAYQALRTPDIGDGRVTNSASAIVQAIDRIFSSGGGGALWDSLTGTTLADALTDRKDPTIIARILDTAEKNNDLRLRVINSILSAIAGSPENMDDLFLDMATSGNMKFSEDFKKGIFNAIIRRNKPPSQLPHLWDQQGLMQGFSMLYREYRLNRYDYPGYKKEELTNGGMSHLNKTWRHSTYRDFSFLPSYIDLFGGDAQVLGPRGPMTLIDNWKRFCPTFDDLGVSVFQTRFLVRPTNEPSLEALHDKPASLGDDKVPPIIRGGRRGCVITCVGP